MRDRLGPAGRPQGRTQPGACEGRTIPISREGTREHLPLLIATVRSTGNTLLLTDTSHHRLRGKHRAASSKPLRPGFHGKPGTLLTASTWIAAESSPPPEKYDLTDPVARETRRNGPFESLVRRSGDPVRSIPSTLSPHGGVHRASFHVNHRLLAQRSPSSGLPARSRRP